MDPRLKEYAQLVIEVGLNLQKGQTLVLRAPVQSAEFARLCAEAAYAVGCREVITDFTDQALNRMKYLHAEDSVFDECPAWYADKMNSLARGRSAFLHIAGDNPDMMRGIDPDRMRRNQQTSGKALHEYQQAMMTNKARWCIAAVPINAWAAKVFPGKSTQEATEALWEAIYKTMRITGDGQAVARWREHSERTLARCTQLNALGLTSLHYTNGLGTDLHVGLPEGAIWAGGSEKDPDGIAFIANMPTEEIFTVPHRERVNGRVVSAMPFVLNGHVIERFAFTLENGKIVGIESGSEADNAMLHSAITVDEGASYLGEVALVPHDSPISNLGILFYNTLFDENASCHFAFGEAYPCIEGAEGLSREELSARGVNHSFTHQDFMVGTPDLSIVGTTKDGRTVTIFKDGNFAL